MHLLIVLIGLFSFASALPAVVNNTEGTALIKPAIIGGNPPNKIYFYEVAIIPDTTQDKLCSGVLIKNNWVLTSAYCVKDYQVLRVAVGINAFVPGIGVQVGRLVDRIITHPYYNALYMLHDIALLYVSRGVTDDSYATFAVLPNLPLSATEYYGQTAVISGFGLDGNNDMLNTYALRSKNVQIIDNVHCFQEGHYMNYYKICSSGRAVCQGDQGSPLIIGNTVVGIASAALRALKCESEVSTTYTRVNYYRQWIDQTIYNVCRC